MSFLSLLPTETLVRFDPRHLAPCCQEPHTAEAMPLKACFKRCELNRIPAATAKPAIKLIAFNLKDIVVFTSLLL
jgi:hypothetical protein